MAQHVRVRMRGPRARWSICAPRVTARDRREIERDNESELNSGNLRVGEWLSLLSAYAYAGESTLPAGSHVI
eukprot:COSAG02_NODE_1242_length_13682_cov_1219.312523_12_plen_72_part_00